jgi:hypothetical protein
VASGKVWEKRIKDKQPWRKLLLVDGGAAGMMPAKLFIRPVALRDGGLLQ